MMLVVKFYASLREAIGDEVQVDFKPQGTAQELLGELMQLYPESAEVLQVSRLAFESEILMVDTKIDEEKEVHVLPPSSGG